MKNQVKKLREAKGLTQTQLAKRVKTSQQQIQRVEAGIHAVRVDLAAALAVALDENLGTVFPELAKTAKGLARRRNFDFESLYSDKAKSKFASAGMNTDTCYWNMELNLPGNQLLSYAVSDADRINFSKFAITASDEGFFCFLAKTHYVCVRMRSIRYSRFLMEPLDVEIQSELQGAETNLPDQNKLRVYFGDGSTPVDFEVEPDILPNDVEEDQSEGQFSILFESIGHGYYTDTGMSFDDSDGEPIILNPSRIAVIEIPLPIVDD